MKDELIASVSGLRGIAGGSLTTMVAVRYVAALESLLPPGPIVIGRDGRESGPEYCSAIKEFLTSRGRDVLDAGIASTPTLGILVQSRAAAGGIQISASHNSAKYNGLKCFRWDGRILPAEAELIVCDRAILDWPDSPVAQIKSPRKLAASGLHGDIGTDCTEGAGHLEIPGAIGRGICGGAGSAGHQRG